MNVSAPCSGPHSKSMSGQCTATLGSPGRAPRTISSMLGWVAAVSATESPPQLRPPFIQRMCTTGSVSACVIGTPHFLTKPAPASSALVIGSVFPLLALLKTEESSSWTYLSPDLTRSRVFVHVTWGAMDMADNTMNSHIEVVPVVVVSQTFPARPSSIPDIRDFVRRCLAQSPMSDQDNREIGETVSRALLDAAGPTGAISVSFRIFPDHVEVDVLKSGAQITAPAGIDALTSLLRAHSAAGAAGQPPVADAAQAGDPLAGSAARQVTLGAVPQDT